MELVKKIDIHCHTISSRGIVRKHNGNTFCLPEELIEMYKVIGIEKAVISPIFKAEQSIEVNTNREIRDIVEKYPESFAWFCGVDPRQGENNENTDFTYILSYYKSVGAKGIGEITTIPAAPAVAGAYYAKDGVLRTKLPLENTYYRKNK